MQIDNVFGMTAAVNQDFVKEDELPVEESFTKNLIHGEPQCGGRVTQSERHRKILEEAEAGAKCRFGDVGSSDADQVVAHPHI